MFTLTGFLCLFIIMRHQVFYLLGSLGENKTLLKFFWCLIEMIIPSNIVAKMHNFKFLPSFLGIQTEG